MRHEFNLITQGIADLLIKWEPILLGLTEEVITSKTNERGRTIKQLIGHLCDSAANNHQRIVRLQYNDVLDFADYTQDNDLWITIQDYQEADWVRLVNFWKYYNWQLIQVISNVDILKLNNKWTNYNGDVLTLREVIEGYYWHINFHTGEIKKMIEP